jgi:tRNA G18 (ribose-2'-O)-methylase SpoU
MPQIEIESLDDLRLEPYRNLKHTNLTRWSGRFIAEGRLVVERLLASGLTVESVLVSRRRQHSVADQITADVPALVLADVLARPMLGYNFHAGVLACARRPPPRDVNSVVGNHPGPLTLVVCDRVVGPENLGAILRLGAAFGVDAILIGKGSADAYSRRVLRVSMGAAFGIPIVESLDLTSTIVQLTQQGIETIAAVADPAADPLPTFRRASRAAIVLGNEYAGLSPELAANCDHRVTIPMAAGANSINVATAAAILLYELSAGKKLWPNA